MKNAVIALRACTLAAITYADGRKVTGVVHFLGHGLAFPYIIDTDGDELPQSRTVAGRYFLGNRLSRLDVVEFRVVNP